MAKAATATAKTVKVKVRALTDSVLDWDFVVIGNRSNRMERFAFQISKKGTPDDAVIETEIDADKQADFEAAVTEKEGVVIKQNPEWEDVKTDDGADGDTTADDGINDGDRYNWATYGKLYEIV